MTRSEVGATLLVLIVAIVGVIAFWPRADEGTTATAPPPVAGPTVSADEIAAARAGAALAPCPEPLPGATPVAGPLEGLVLGCLGGPGQVDLAAALPGRVTLVNLWASWCGPCREEIPALRDYAARPGAAEVLGVDVADDPTDALALLTEFGARYPSVTDPQQVVGRRLGAPPVLPASVLVRPDGSVVPLPPEVFDSPDAVEAAVDAALGAVAAGPVG